MPSPTTKSALAVLFLVFSLSAVPVSALQLEVGAIAGGGLCFTFGSYLDAKAAYLAEQGASGPTPGTIRYNLFPGLSAGAYGEMALLRWLDLRLELRASYLGASRLALTAGGLPLDAYGAGLYALMLPVLVRASFPLGPGSITADLGPFYGLVVGDVHVQDVYATTSTSAVIPLSFAQSSMFGVSGGVGYKLGLGPGTASVELRADWTIFPVKLDGGLGSGDLSPLNALIVFGYGFKLGSAN
jgi:hypothetical protein